jgi:hypothetical protein
MSLPKLALTAVFLLSICSPALAENTVEKPVVQNNSIVSAVNYSPQASVPQDTRSIRGSRGDRSGVSTNSDQLNYVQIGGGNRWNMSCGSHTSKFSETRRGR